MQWTLSHKTHLRKSVHSLISSVYRFPDLITIESLNSVSLRLFLFETAELKYGCVKDRL